LAEGTVRLWDPATGEELRRLMGHRGGVCALAFSPDGKLLVSGGGDSTVLIWDMSAPPRRPRPAGDLTAEQLKDLWADLAGKDAAKAYRAIAALADHPAQAGPFLRDTLRQNPGIEGKQLARLIADLDADDFKLREKASRELARLGRLAEPALKEALRQEPSTELARRARELLKKMDGEGPPPPPLRTLRAIEALERLGTPPAREALRTLAQRDADPSLVREAKASLRRLGQQPPTP
jgi:hypothetical protein